MFEGLWRGVCEDDPGEEDVFVPSLVGQLGCSLFSVHWLLLNQCIHYRLLKLFLPGFQPDAFDV